MIDPSKLDRSMKPGDFGPSGLIPGHFDSPPMNAITADQVRLNRELTADACAHGGAVCCEAKRYKWVIEGAIKHPGCSSSLRAALEAAVEKWPASPTT